MTQPPAGSIPEVVAQRAACTPDELFMADSSGATLTFGELAAAVEQTARGVARWGVRPGDVVSWQLPNGCATVVLMLALRRLSAVQNPLVTTLGLREVSFICEQAHASHLVVPSRSGVHDYLVATQPIAGQTSSLQVHALDDELLPGVAEQPHSQASNGDDECRWLFYTSGTTSSPKGVRHSDQSLIAASRHQCDTLNLGPNDQLAAPLPLAHVGGILHVLSALIAGASMLTCARFDDDAINFFSARRVTILGSGVPFFHAYLKRQRARQEGPLFPHLRAALSGGAPCPPSLRQTIRRELGGAGVSSGWGLTECPFLTIGRLEDDGVSEGRPAVGSTVEAVRPDGTPAPPGQEGELRVKSPQLMLGYTDPTLTADAFDDRGYFRTGDLGVVEPSGIVRITGRLKDIIIRKMENVSAQEVEELLSTHPAVADVAVLGLPDEHCGERVCAVIVAADHRNPPELAELGAHLRDLGLSTRKLPEQLEVLDALPRNAMGKVVKSELRARLTPDVAQR